MLTITEFNLMERVDNGYWLTSGMSKTIAKKKEWSALDILRLDRVSALSRLEIVLDPDLIPESELRLIAADFADMVLDEWESVYPDDLRPRTAIDLAIGYALEVVDDSTLRNGRSAASRAMDSSFCSDKRAPWFAARAAGWSATKSPNAALMAAMEAAISVSWSTGGAVWSIEWVRARWGMYDRQIAYLIERLEA